MVEKVQQLSQNYLNRKSTIIAVVCVISKHFSTQVFSGGGGNKNVWEKKKMLGKDSTSPNYRILQLYQQWLP